MGLPLTAQKLRKADHAIINHLKSHVSYLADDKLEGRRAGTAGEQLAIQYIQAQFEKNGLQPMGGDKSFVQAFDIREGSSFDAHSYLFINGEKISPNDYFPLPSSPRSTIDARPSMALKEAGVPWFLDMKDDLEAAKQNPHFSINQYMDNKAKDASKKGDGFVCLQQ